MRGTLAYRPDWRAAGDEARFTLRYDMHMRMAVGPAFVSVCEARDGKVIDLDEDYDFGSSLVSPFPRLERAHRGIVNAFFL